jgi:hypothetical protein
MLLYKLYSSCDATLFSSAKIIRMKSNNILNLTVLKSKMRPICFNPYQFVTISFSRHNFPSDSTETI